MTETTPEPKLPEGLDGNKDDNVTADDERQSLSSGLMARFRRYFLTGILVTAPISITIYLTYLFLTFVDNRVVHLLPAEWYEVIYPKTTIPGLGVIIVVAAFISIGWFATNFLGRLFIRFSEYIVDQMPVIRTLYGAIKQIFETIMASKSTAFREVVMLEYPRKDVWSIGFVTGASEGEVQSHTSQETVNVFVPTTPNPTSGYLLFVPKKDLAYLDMSVEEGVKLVVSAGIIMPSEHKEALEKSSKKTGFFNLHKNQGCCK
ncbi:MAG: DUF502 domain-containing protein [Alphaproteobacteria bacterium]|nr:DUF502 domain-containing protein [Alphaproteobacteria bacterium]